MKWLHMAAIAALGFSVIAPAKADETLKLGMSAVLSGPGAFYGTGAVWTAQQAAKAINEAGGVKADGKTYKLEIVAYDNKYSATDGAKVAQTLIVRDGIKHIIATQSTAAVSALQAISERRGVLHFTGAWGKRLRGKEFPLTFTMLNSPGEILQPLYSFIQEAHPEAKRVALFNPNDASGQDIQTAAIEHWKALGYEIVSDDLYERSTTDFAPIATRIMASKPDIIDVGGTPLPNAGQLFKELKIQGWDGVKIASAGSSPDALVKTGGDAAEDVYLGLAAVFTGDKATAVEATLNEGAIKDLGQPLDQVTISPWDSIAALKAGIEKADSIEPEAIAKVLPEIIFESSYGPAGFGLADVYGLPNQMLLPVIISQIKDGKAVEMARINPAELAKKLGN